MTVQKCAVCPLLFIVPRNHHRRKFCSAECHRLFPILENKLWLDEVKWLDGTDTWEHIAERLGMSRASLERKLIRLGENEMARRVHDTGMPRTYYRAA